MPAATVHVFILPIRRGTQVVRERSAKPLCVGSIPTRASNFSTTYSHCMRWQHATGCCEGRKPYGARVGEPAVIARMKTMRDACTPCATIAATLNAEGIPSRAGRWHPNSVRRVVVVAAQVRRATLPILDIRAERWQKAFANPNNSPELGRPAGDPRGFNQFMD